MRTNEGIRAATVRLIDDKNEQLGIMGADKARMLAKEKGLDLVEVSPNTHPPVCRLMDYGKHIYKQKKQEQTHRKMQKQTEVKTVRLSLRTGLHDLQTKAKKASEFLADRNLVKIALVFKGREATHAELGMDQLNKFITLVGEEAVIDTPPKRQGNNLLAILAPKK